MVKRQHPVGLDEAVGEWVVVGGHRRWTGPISEETYEDLPDRADCGTTRGYHKHYKAGEDACPRCKEAERLNTRNKRDAEDPEVARLHACRGLGVTDLPDLIAQILTAASPTCTTCDDCGCLIHPGERCPACLYAAEREGARASWNTIRHWPDLEESVAA